ncbi:MotA/TolQ/ExbB proton channel family protein, partial [Campylobacter jejuni]|nr:MotA/TolQ/ExbB proton channel family protein [Campylobacter jejuni]
SIIAPKISEALVATGCGILVAIPAYTFHLIIKRKAFELLSIIDSEIKVISSSK